MPNRWTDKLQDTFPCRDTIAHLVIVSHLPTITFDDLINGLSKLHFLGKEVVGLHVAVVEFHHLVRNLGEGIDEHKRGTRRSGCKKT